jgi:hypothetical protein
VRRRHVVFLTPKGRALAERIDRFVANLSKGGVNMWKISFLAIVAAVLAGCAQQYAKIDDAKCQDMSAARGSDRYYDCRMALEKQRGF